MDMSKELERLYLEEGVKYETAMSRIGTTLRMLMVQSELSSHDAFRLVRAMHPEIDWDEFHGLQFSGGSFSRYADVIKACGFTLEHVQAMRAYQAALFPNFDDVIDEETDEVLEEPVMAKCLSDLASGKSVRTLLDLDNAQPDPAGTLRGYVRRHLMLDTVIGHYLEALTDQQRRYYLQRYRNELVDSRGHDRQIYRPGNRNICIGVEDVSARDFQLIMAPVPFADCSIVAVALRAALSAAQIDSNYAKPRAGTDENSLERQLILDELFASSSAAQEMMSRVTRHIEAMQTTDRSLRFRPGESIADIMAAVAPITRELNQLLREINDQQRWTELIAALSDETPNSTRVRTAFETLHSWEQRLATLFASL